MAQAYTFLISLYGQPEDTTFKLGRLNVTNKTSFTVNTNQTHIPITDHELNLHMCLKQDQNNIFEGKEKSDW